jgi:hypothetical protein
MYKKLVYAPLVSRYSQAEYVNRLNDKLYIDTLPTLPVTADNDSKGAYLCFEMWDESMNDGSDNSFNIGDILICREIDYAVRQRRLYFNKPKPFVIIHATKGIIVRQITAHDLDSDLVTAHSPNPTYDDVAIRMSEVKQLFNIIRLERNVY